jgi:hypothetical protein
MDQSLLYRSLLRVSVVVTAIVLLFQSGLVDDRTTVVFLDTTENLQAMVGLSVSVAPTEINSFTAELTKRQQLLNAREETIASRENELGLTGGSAQNNTETTTYILAAILLIQLILLILNYLLDYVRSRENQVNPIDGPVPN